MNGVIVKDGYIAAEWGDIHRVDMTFSVAKSYVSTMAGIAYDRGLIRGSGEWGYDDVYVDGERDDGEIWLIIEFNHYNPIEFEGRVRGSELEGYLYGSGYDGVRVRFRRESRR